MSPRAGGVQGGEDVPHNQPSQATGSSPCIYGAEKNFYIGVGVSEI